jgi:hypothetical protein
MRYLLVLLALAALMNPRPSPGVELSASFWQMTPDGDLQVGSDGEAGTKVNLEDDLGYGDSESVMGFDGVIGQNHQLAISYFGLDLSAENRVDRAVRFSDLTFRVNADVSSSLEASLWRAAYRYAAGSESVRGGFLIGVQYVDLTAEASASGVGTASESAQVGLPAVGGFLEWQLHEMFRVQGSLTGGTWSWDNISATFWDGEVSARLIVSPFLAGIGYRYIALEGEDDDLPVEVDLSFAGPTAFAGVSF